MLGDFISFFEKEYNVFTEILFESTVKGLAGMVGLSKKLVGSQAYRKRVEHYLRLIDVGIKRLDVQAETIFDEHTGKKKKEKVVRTVHDIYDPYLIILRRFYNSAILDLMFPRYDGTVIERQ